MNTSTANTNHSHPNACGYALRRERAALEAVVEMNSEGAKLFHLLRLLASA